MAPRKANKPKLTRQAIVSAAMKLIDQHGLEGQSMRQIGAEVGFDASTIYYYIPSKAALYDLIVDEILGGIDLSLDDPSAELEERVVAAGWAYRRALLRHPRAVPLVAVRSLRTPVQLRVIETLSRIFFNSGFSPTETLLCIDTCGMTILGMTNMYAASITGSEYHERETDLNDVDPDRFPPEQYPILARMVSERAALDPDLEFDRAMRAMAKGLLAMHEAGTLEPEA